jgi:membrane protein implicated in regulation of membrane protease activity
MTWWIWLIAGFVCLAGETLTPGLFYLAFLGVSACVVALIAWVSPSSELWFQVLCFSIVMTALAFFRTRLLAVFHVRPPQIPVDELSTEIAVALEDIAAGSQGKAELRGAHWTARNVGAVPMAARDRCRVVRVDGLVLEVRKD